MNMLRHTLIATTLGLALALPANAETKSYKMDSFQKLSVAAGVTVVFEASDSQSIVAENKNGNFDKLILKTSGDTLIISRESSGWLGFGNRENYTVRISAPAISAVSASSGAQVQASGIASERVSLKVSSGANLDAMDISAGSVALAASSGSCLLYTSPSPRDRG